MHLKIKEGDIVHMPKSKYVPKICAAKLTCDMAKCALSLLHLMDILHHG